MSQPDTISDIISETQKRVPSVEQRLGVTIRGALWVLWAYRSVV